jgi:hypothetical protein
MNSIRRVLLFSVLGVWIGGAAGASDFGLVLSPSGEYVSDTGGKGFGFTGTITPWFSAAIGERAGVYVSGKLTIDYEYDTEEWKTPFLFELERTELTFRPVPAAYIRLGRQRYQDNGEMIASGLFDGLSFNIGFTRARLSLGGFYTGLLYKESAEILMNAGDSARFAEALDYGDLDTYFASRRILLPLGLEFPDLGSRMALGLTLLAQFDVNKDSGAKLHTQYLETLVGFEALDTLRFTVTALGGAAEEDGELLFHGAGAFGFDWDFPGALTDMFHGEIRWGSGAINDSFVPFIPVTKNAQGTVFTPSLAGLMNVRASYTARLHKTASVSAETIGFWRTDVETLRDAELEAGSTERFLGVEARVSFVWAPQSVLRFSAGGGAFFPGGAFQSDAGIRWKINGGFILSL